MPTATKRSESYDTLLKLGWHWARVDNDVPHLVPPRGDAALCMRACERGRRIKVTVGIHAGGCRKCKARAGLS